MYFVHQALTVAFLLVLVPLLIHLINLMRHRRVRWAAMDFLLQSYKKHRRWVWLKQLLLLLARMLAIAAVVAMLAKLITRDQWTALFGGKPIHHYVLLDDSYSMGDRNGGASALEAAKRVVGRIGGQAAVQESRQRLSLIRFSEADRLATQQATAEQAQQMADLNAVLIDSQFDMLLEERRRAFDVTQLSVGPLPALSVVRQLVAGGEEETAVVYLVSDFRARQWENPAELKQSLRALTDLGADVRLVRCIEARHGNLAVARLEPVDATRAAGVPIVIEVEVKNFDEQPARNVQLTIRTTYYPEQGGESKQQTSVLPTVAIEEIPPGETAVVQREVFFPGPGKQIVEAELEADALDVDNRRWCVLDLPPAVPVLLIDGDPQGRSAYFLTSVFQPGGNTTTGIRPDVQTAEFLREASVETLQQYQAIYLLNVPQLDERAVANVERFVRDGGGLGVFLGPQSKIAFYDQWHRRDDGLFPVPLSRLDVLAPAADDAAPDVAVEDHPVFRVLLGQQNPFIRGLTVEQYVRAEDDWQPAAESTTRVIARLRNRQPLVVERRFGRGRVLVTLTTAAPLWNNLARNPSFVIVALQMQSHLAAPSRSFVDRLVGAPIRLQVDGDRFDRDLSFLLPESDDRTAARVVEVRAEAPSPEATLLEASLGWDAKREHPTRQTARSGIYEAHLASVDGDIGIERFALNVEAEEGDLALIDSPQLADQLDPLPITLHEAGDFEASAEQEGFSWTEILLFGLLGLLLGEQILAYSASYHPARGGKR